MNKTPRLYNKKYVIEVIEELRATGSSKAKIEILKKAAATPYFLKVMKATYDPFTQYYIKKIPDYRPYAQGTGSLSKAIDQLTNVIATRQITGNKAIDYIAKMLETLPAHDSKVIELILARDIKAGLSASTLNKAYGDDFIPQYPCMLCEKFNEKTIQKISYPAYVQTKMDGMRANAIVEGGKVEFRSRNGKLIETHGKLDEEVLRAATNSNMVFDGELLVLEDNGEYMSRKKGNGICNKAIRGSITEEDAARLVYVVWDVLPLGEFRQGQGRTPYNLRFDAVRIRTQGLEKLRLVESEEVDSFYAAQQFYLRQLNLGREGAIIKNAKSLWENKRSKDQIKLKVENEADLVITDVIEGTGKYMGKLGSFLCATSDGLLEVSVGSGLNDEQRDMYFTKNMIGKVIAVKYNEIIEARGSNTKSLFLPIFVELRTDKDTANTIDELK